jgi:hypothetical protein
MSRLEDYITNILEDLDNTDNIVHHGLFQDSDAYLIAFTDHIPGEILNRIDHDGALRFQGISTVDSEDHDLELALTFEG